MTDVSLVFVTSISALPKSGTASIDLWTFALWSARASGSCLIPPRQKTRKISIKRGGLSIFIPFSIIQAVSVEDLPEGADSIAENRRRRQRTVVWGIFAGEASRTNIEDLLPQRPFSPWFFSYIKILFP
ncbi:hypothetical protein C8J56DRAFT_879555 [Mycena floridula]|nr:hypothetical protein C8J56DRAFT_879555 [Mycena floridula]